MAGGDLVFVWKENHRAVTFYLKRGFTITGNHGFKISETPANPNSRFSWGLICTKLVFNFFCRVCIHGCTGTEVPCYIKFYE